MSSIDRGVQEAFIYVLTSINIFQVATPACSGIFIPSGMDVL